MAVSAVRPVEGFARRVGRPRERRSRPGFVGQPVAQVGWKEEGLVAVAAQEVVGHGAFYLFATSEPNVSVPKWRYWCQEEPGRLGGGPRSWSCVVTGVELASRLTGIDVLTSWQWPESLSVATPTSPGVGAARDWACKPPGSSRQVAIGGPAAAPAMLGVLQARRTGELAVAASFERVDRRLWHEFSVGLLRRYERKRRCAQGRCRRRTRQATRVGANTWEARDVPHRTYPAPAPH
jgi:hypothetical protein